MRFEDTHADRLTAAVFLAIGTAMLYGGFVMDRLEIRQIHPASIPGLVPMMLGAALMLCAVLLFLSARKPKEDTSPAPEKGSVTNLAIAAGWSAVFALARVGRAPFWLATCVYIAAFAIYFGWPSEAGVSRRIRWSVLSIIFALIMAVAISTLFRYGFLVRLP